MRPIVYFDNNADNSNDGNDDTMVVVESPNCSFVSFEWLVNLLSVLFFSGTNL